MKINSIKIALTGVLIYLCFTKVYDLLTAGLLLLNTEMRIKNETILFILISLIGIISLLVLVFLTKKTLNTNQIKPRVLYILLGTSILLSVGNYTLNKLFSNYAEVGNTDGFIRTYLHQFGLNISLGLIFPLLGLIYFLWLIKKNDVANTP